MVINNLIRYGILLILFKVGSSIAATPAVTYHMVTNVTGRTCGIDIGHASWVDMGEIPRFDSSREKSKDIPITIFDCPAERLHVGVEFKYVESAPCVEGSPCFIDNSGSATGYGFYISGNRGYINPLGYIDGYTDTFGNVTLPFKITFKRNLAQQKTNSGNVQSELELYFVTDE